MAKSIRSGTEHLIADEIFHVGLGACTSFKIKKIKLPLTMPLPRADLLLQMPHPGEGKVVKCPTNARGVGGGRVSAHLELTQP